MCFGLRMGLLPCLCGPSCCIVQWFCYGCCLRRCCCFFRLFSVADFEGLFTASPASRCSSRGRLVGGGVDPCGISKHDTITMGRPGGLCVADCWPWIHVASLRHAGRSAHTPRDIACCLWQRMLFGLIHPRLATTPPIWHPDPMLATLLCFGSLA